MVILFRKAPVFLNGFQLSLVLLCEILGFIHNVGFSELTLNPPEGIVAGETPSLHLNTWAVKSSVQALLIRPLTHNRTGYIRTEHQDETMIRFLPLCALQVRPTRRTSSNGRPSSCEYRLGPFWQDVSMETNMIHCPSSFLLIWFSLGIIYPEILDAHRTQTDFIQPVKLSTCFQVQCVTLTSRCHCWFRQQLKVEADLFTFGFYRINQHKAVLDCEIMGFSYHEVVICVFLLFLTSFSIPQKNEIHSFLLNVLF